MATSFETIRQTTLCPYAARANVSYGPAWLQELSARPNWDRIAASLAEWADRAYETRSHGYVIEIGGVDADDFDEVRRTLRRTLTELNARDPAESNCLQEDLEDPGWQFDFAGLRLFANVFAPCYSPGHTKHSPVPHRVYVFFQPEFAFDFCGINPRNRAARELVRRRFLEAGSPYNGELIDRRQEAYLYMFPLDPMGQPVKWWTD